MDVITLGDDLGAPEFMGGEEAAKMGMWLE